MTDTFAEHLHQTRLGLGRRIVEHIRDGTSDLAEAPMMACLSSGIPKPGEGEVLVKTLDLAFDPAQNGWMENIGGYVAPTEIGEVMRGGRTTPPCPPRSCSRSPTTTSRPPSSTSTRSASPSRATPW